MDKYWLCKVIIFNINEGTQKVLVAPVYNIILLNGMNFKTLQKLLLEQNANY